MRNIRIKIRFNIGFDKIKGCNVDYIRGGYKAQARNLVQTHVFTERLEKHEVFVKNDFKKI